MKLIFGKSQSKSLQYHINLSLPNKAPVLQVRVPPGPRMSGGEDSSTMFELRVECLSEVYYYVSTTEVTC